MMVVPGQLPDPVRTAMTRPTPAEKARLEHRDAVAAVIYPGYPAVRAAQKVRGAARPRITVGQEFWADEAQQKADAILALPGAGIGI